jgi:tRNA A-37 threonylcarbamoyl transferase component Bud32
MIPKPTPQIQAADAVVRRIERLDWHVRLKYWTDDLKKMMEDPDLFLDHDAEVFKREQMDAVGAGRGFVVKRHHFRTAADLVKGLFRPSHARRAWHKALQLEQAGIATAKPIAYADRRRWGMLIASYFVMERIAGAVDLNSYRGNKAGTARRLADLLARLHGEGFAHRDLKGSNVVFDSDGRPYLIDLDGLRYLRRVNDAWEIADLARLAQAATSQCRATRSDCARFLKSYCQLRRRGDWRAWWQAIAQKRTRA